MYIQYNHDIFVLHAMIMWLLFVVYCTALLTAHKLDGRAIQTEHNPQFYINVADIEALNSTRTYVACTYIIVILRVVTMCLYFCLSCAHFFK